jgi:hypothetical protein
VPRGLLFAAAALLLAAAAPLAGARTDGPATPQRAAQAPGGEGWTANASAYRGRNGERFVYTCPRYGAPGAVWGTDLYTDDSSVCTAAVHTGSITLAGGGTVTIEIRPGEQAYTGSTRNRITSSSYPAWSGSFVVVSAVPQEAGIGEGGADWAANAARFRPFVGAQFRYTCPAGGPIGTVWGTDVYTDDSSVCTAAVHAGRITVAAGGTVIIEMRDGQAEYTASTRNGIESRPYPAWGGSFVVLGAPTQQPPGGTPQPGAPPQGTATGTVTVNGQPFTTGTVPFGATVDVTEGRLTMRADVGTLQVFGDGRNAARFVPRRATERVNGRTRTLIQLTLAGGDFGVCRRRGIAGVQQQNRGEVRSLWGNGTGRFRSRGRFATATVRGTRWRTVDRCDGTLTVVRQGVVEVRDLTRRRTVRVRAGRSYLAPARR